MEGWIQAAEMGFPQRGARLSLRDGWRSSTIRRELGVAAPPHLKESAEVVHLVRMHPGSLPLEVFQACPTGRRPWFKV